MAEEEGGEGEGTADEEEGKGREGREGARPAPSHKYFGPVPPLLPGGR